MAQLATIKGRVLVQISDGEPIEVGTIEIPIHDGAPIKSDRATAKVDVEMYVSAVRSNDEIAKIMADRLDNGVRGIA